MLFSSLALAAASLAFVVQGIPVSEASDLAVLYEYTGGDGVSTITVYGDATQSNYSTEPEVSPSEVVEGFNLKRSCDGTVVCDNENMADRLTCGHLIAELRGDNAALGASPRSICGNFNGGLCCISWHTVVSEATRNSLVSAAERALDSCGEDTGVSAKVKNTMIGQTCTDQCMSNRAKSCWI